MKNVRRAIEQQLIKAMELFPAIVLTGPRRAGKTFLLRSLFPKFTYVQLEDPDLLLAVKDDPRGFLDNLALPVIIDEIQQAPELFSYIRSRIDEQPEKKGQWILTGSQESLLMQGVSESMTGRAAIMRLAPFSHFEYDQVTAFTGGYPETFAEKMDREIWYSSYIQTYLERDVRSLVAVRNLATFHRFLKVLATRHGQMLNKTAIAAPLGVSVPTLTEWINVLEISGIVKLVPPYYRNAGKRLVKTPKLYFLDSGLVCHLLGIQSVKSLESSPFYGAIFEGFMVAEVLKSQWAQAKGGDVYYFRDEQGLEVDIVFSSHEGSVTLAECKSSSTLSPQMSAPMRKLGELFKGEGLQVDMRLVYNPEADSPRAPTAGAGVKALSWQEFVQELNQM